MSVRPVRVLADGAIDAISDEYSHSGTIPAAEVMWFASFNSVDSHQYIVLACPDGCGSVSTHPVGGGAAPVEVQRMFVDKTTRDGCVCGTVAAGRSDSVPEAHVHLNVSRMDGPQRWQLDDAVQVAVQAGQAPMFQVVYRRTDGLVVGTHPRGGVGPDHGVSVIHDMAEWDVLMRTDPAYLSADGDHIVSEPRT